MIGKLRVSNLMGASWELLKKERKIVVAEIVLLLALMGILVSGTFLAIRAGSTSDFILNENTFQAGFTPSLVSIVIWVLTFYIASIATELATAFIFVSALARFRGDPISAKVALQKVKQRGWSVIKFTTLSSFVGGFFQLIQEYVPYVGAKIISWIGGAIWAAASVFATIIIVDQKEDNPFKAVQNSTNMLKKTLGDGIKVQLGLISVVLMGIMTTVLITLIASTLVAVVGLPFIVFNIVSLALPLIGLFTVIILTGAYRAIVIAALYQYAVSGKAPTDFDKEMLLSAITRKKARKAFGW